MPALSAESRNQTARISESLRVPRRQTVFVDDGPELLKMSRRWGYRPEQVFLKYNDTEFDVRKVPNNHLTYPISLELEFGWLRDLHEAAPHHMVRPIALIRRRQEAEAEERPVCSAVGYLMEFVDGISLSELEGRMLTEGWKCRFRGETIREQLLQHVDNAFIILNGLHAKGLGHGDVDIRNMMVTKTGFLKLLDPIPEIANGKFDFESQIKNDLKKMREIMHWYDRICRKEVFDH